MLQAGRLQVEVPVRSLNLFSLPNPSSHNLSLEFTHPLTEMSAGIILGSRTRPALNGDNLSVICELFVKVLWDPQHLSTLQASTACNRDRITFFF
jgi:hypothetical protein